jgi:hypothetical protein
MFEKRIIITDKNTDRLLTLLIQYLNRRNSDIIDFVDGDTTPSVKVGSKFKTNNSTAKTITQLDDGEDGQEVTIIAGDGNTTINTGGNFRLISNWTPVQNDAIRLIKSGSLWIEPR